MAMEEFNGIHWGDSHTGNHYQARLTVRKRFTLIPRRDYETEQWVMGVCYRDEWGNYYHPSTTVANLLSGDFYLSTD